MKTTFGLIAGMAVGAGLGMLIAPDKKSKTRKKLAGSAADWMEKIKGLFSSGEEQPQQPLRPRPKSHQLTPRTT